MNSHMKTVFYIFSVLVKVFLCFINILFKYEILKSDLNTLSKQKSIKFSTRSISKITVVILNTNPIKKKKKNLTIVI